MEANGPSATSLLPEATAPSAQTFHITLSTANPARLRQDLLSIRVATEIALERTDDPDAAVAVDDAGDILEDLENVLTRCSPIAPSNLTIRIAVTAPPRLRRDLWLVQVAVEASIRVMDKFAKVSNEEAAVPGVRLLFAVLERGLRGNDSVH